MLNVSKASIALSMAIPLCGEPAYADFIFLSCGASAGSTYYMEGGMVSAAHAGWQKDSIDDSIQLLIKDDKTFDLISRGPPPNDFKYSDHGCKFGTVSLSSDKNELVVFAHCPKQLEVYFFNWKDDKTGEVVREDVSSGLTKHGGTLHATCQLGEH